MTRCIYFLTEFSGCRFSSANTLPFGFGKHLYPGLKLSKATMDTTLDIVRSNSSSLREHLIPSGLAPGLPTAFLVYA